MAVPQGGGEPQVRPAGHTHTGLCPLRAPARPPALRQQGELPPAGGMPFAQRAGNDAESLQPALLVGGPGTAKTNIVNQFLGGFSPEHMLSKTINFSSLTTPGIFQLTVEVSGRHCPLPCLLGSFKQPRTSTT